jgi:hypothetical protein
VGQPDPQPTGKPDQNSHGYYDRGIVARYAVRPSGQGQADQVHPDQVHPDQVHPDQDHRDKEHDCEPENQMRQGQPLGNSFPAGHAHLTTICISASMEI